MTRIKDIYPGCLVLPGTYHHPRWGTVTVGNWMDWRTGTCGITTADGVFVIVADFTLVMP